LTRTTKQIGQTAEDAARQYLQKQGLTFVEANFTTRLGEIDLIMKDNKTLVFVEVRLRNNKHYASALESVDFRKQTKLRKAALSYLQKEQLFDKVACRFDVIAAEADNNTFKFQWIKNAF